MSIAKWLDANDNEATVQIAADIAEDAIRGYATARDIAMPKDRTWIRDQAETIGYALRNGVDANDPAGQIAREIIKEAGFQVTSGTIGFDALISPVAA